MIFVARGWRAPASGRPNAGALLSKGDLRAAQDFVEHVGVTSTGHELYARFDSVIVRGFPYRIASIHAISREAARTLRSADKVG